MFFKLPWFKAKTKAETQLETQAHELDFLVDEFCAALADIADPLTIRMHAALIAVQTPKDLWFLRGKLFNLIAKHHCEKVAHERVSRLDQKLRFFVDHHPHYSSEEMPTGPMGLLH